MEGNELIRKLRKTDHYTEWMFGADPHLAHSLIFRTNDRTGRLLARIDYREQRPYQVTEYDEKGQAIQVLQVRYKKQKSVVQALKEIDTGRAAERFLRNKSRQEARMKKKPKKKKSMPSPKRTVIETGPARIPHWKKKK